MGFQFLKSINFSNTISNKLSHFKKNVSFGSCSEMATKYLVMIFKKKLKSKTCNFLMVTFIAVG